VGDCSAAELGRRAVVGYAAGMADTLLSLTMLAALASLAGAFVLWRRKGEGRKALLMVVAALVALANVAVWSLPAPAPTGQRP
jgi:drug/metabolite transporter superfamily protein YnfA